MNQKTKKILTCVFLEPIVFHVDDEHKVEKCELDMNTHGLIMNSITDPKGLRLLKTVKYTTSQNGTDYP